MYSEGLLFAFILVTYYECIHMSITTFFHIYIPVFGLSELSG